MKTVGRYWNHRTEQIRQSLVNAGVNKDFVAELDDKVAAELLERISILLKNYEKGN